MIELKYIYYPVERPLEKKDTVVLKITNHKVYIDGKGFYYWKDGKKINKIPRTLTKKFVKYLISINQPKEK